MEEIVIKKNFFKEAMDKTGNIDNEYLNKVLSKHCKIMTKEQYLDSIVSKNRISFVKDTIIFFSSKKAFDDCIEFYDTYFRIVSSCPEYMKQFPKENYLYETIINRYVKSKSLFLPVLRVREEEYIHTFTKQKMKGMICRADTTMDLYLNKALDGRYKVFIWEEGLTQQIKDLEKKLEIIKEEKIKEKHHAIETLCNSYGITIDEFRKLKDEIFEIRKKYEKEGIGYND